jgi:NAD+ synthetase
VISDLYKTEVFEMCRWLNEEYYGEEVIPESIITKPPSAELRPDQKDSDSLPEYEVLDQILALYIEDQSGAQEIIQRGFERETVEKVIRLVDMTEYKRRQSPPGLRISSKAFGIGRRLPIVQDWTNQQFA